MTQSSTFNPYEHHGLFYQGHWQQPTSGATINVYNPCDESLVGTVAVANKEDTAAAIASAHQGISTLKTYNAFQRSVLLNRIADIMDIHTDAAKTLLATELGKPFAQGQRDWELAVDQFRWFAHEVRKLNGNIVDSNVEGCHYEITIEPIGIVGAFTAWNFPPLLAARKIAPAIAAGCSVVLRPSEQAPGIVMLLIECIRLAQTPAGVVNLVVGDIKNTYDVIINEPTVRKVTVTGSTDVGKKIAKDSADTLKKVTMELGGNAPTIIFDDVDDIAALAIKAALVKHANAGQVCAAPDRFYVHDNIYDVFIDHYVKQVNALKVGNCLLDSSVDMGPLVNAKRLDAIERAIQQSIDAGAVLLTGGKRISDTGFLYAPTVLKDVQDTVACLCEENFGPITAFTRFSSEAEVVSRANRSEYGLASYVFTQDKDRVRRLVNSIECGMVGVNTFMLASAQMPFGGIKQSGYGREGGEHCIMEYCTIKVAHHFHQTDA